MKILKTFARNEFILTDDEAANIDRILMAGEKGFIKLRSGETINTQSIDSLTNVPLVAYYRVDGKLYRVLKDGETIVNDYGNRVKIDPDSVEYFDDEKYEALMLASGDATKRLK